MQTWLLVTIIAVAAAAVVVKRLIGEPVNLRDLFGPPVVLTALGVWSVLEAEELNGADAGWAVGGCLIGLGLGALRGATVALSRRNGVLYQRYTGRTFLVVVLALLASALYGLLAGKLGMHEAARPVNLSIGVGFLGEALVIGYRGLRGGTPFAPERPGPLDRYAGRSGRSGRSGRFDWFDRFIRR
ncbi:DUF1453 domain-containing protein [Kitasatospora sp. NPDC056184]|uniref:DUF1453 domain-containing protein n=1 Tax=Kitasatospora sp. NPDC056184 TaxID=3345738 RepID=UPI0035E0F20C